MSEKIDVIILPCNHMCLCYNCCVDFRSKNKKCPICRRSQFFKYIKNREFFVLAIESFVKMEIANQNNYAPTQNAPQKQNYNSNQAKTNY